VAHLSGGGLTTVNDPAGAYLPFDSRASGYVPGEGGAIVVVEDLERARARGARQVYGVIAGYAATFDPRPGSGREPNLRYTIETALADAGATPDDVDVVFADASGIPELDEVEARAIRDVFGPFGVPVTAPKTMTGRLYAGGAALDLATALLAIRDGVVPPTINVADPPAGYDLDLVLGAARELPVRTALILARGRGGFNAAMVVTDHR
jgi:act minimal PKS chain-length factor (CLF/KS beta)